MIAPVSDQRSFEALSTDGQAIRSGPIGARYLPDGATPPRVAFGIGRRYGNAVRRNRARRRLRACWVQVAAMNPNLTGTFLVFTRRDLATVSFADLLDATSSLADKAGEINGGNDT